MSTTTAVVGTLHHSDELLVDCWKTNVGTCTAMRLEGPQRGRYLNVAEVVSSVAAEPRVDEHSIQPVDQRLPLRLRREGPQVQVLWIFHILMTKPQLINTNY